MQQQNHNHETTRGRNTWHVSGRWEKVGNEKIGELKNVNNFLCSVILGFLLLKKCVELLGLSFLNYELIPYC